jgi:hypothetical protein
MCSTEDVCNPCWESAGRVHDWRNYISDEVKELWDSFTDVQRRAIQRQAQQQADDEEWD